VSERGLDPGIVDTYLGAVDWFRGVLGRSEVAAAWSEPSAVADYTVGGVAAHAVHSVLWLEQLLRDSAPAGLRRVTIAEFFGTNRVDGPDDSDPFSGSLRAAAEAFALTGASVVIAACTVSRDELVGLLKTAPADRSVPVIRVAGAEVSLQDYLRTRVLEVVVHGDDVACSVPGLLVADPPAAAVEISLGVCIEMARVRVGDIGALRAFTRAERSEPGALRVL
jgi:Mycothiol maleylpyruvate isomerase N-terminal domain